jgi:hypothetical protein
VNILFYFIYFGALEVVVRKNSGTKMQSEKKTIKTTTTTIGTK